MKYLLHVRGSQGKHGPMTPLQLATTAKYLECGGEHAFTGETIVRDWMALPHNFRVCGRCGVPIRGGQA